MSGNTVRDTVRVYDDVGVDYLSPQGFIEDFQEILGPSTKVERVSAQTLRSKGWEDDTRALFFGGGIASTWDASLGAEGRENIRNFVAEHGGIYVGACSGAMFASKESRFGSIVKSRGIDFFQGRAIGPLNPVEDYRAPSAASAEKVTFTFENETLSGRLYNQGGCYFETSLCNKENVRIIGTYEDSRPAAIFCKGGKGIAFLMGPHAEFSPKPILNSSDPHIIKLAKELKANESFRKNVLKGIATIARLR
jgi:biotin---protein ligase